MTFPIPFPVAAILCVVSGLIVVAAYLVVGQELRHINPQGAPLTFSTLRMKMAAKPPSWAVFLVAGLFMALGFGGVSYCGFAMATWATTALAALPWLQ